MDEDTKRFVGRYSAGSSEMVHTLFVDQSGHEHAESPYEVLAGVAIEDANAPSLVSDILGSEMHFFGQRIGCSHETELHAGHLLEGKTYKLAAQLPAFLPDERRELAHR